MIFQKDFHTFFIKSLYIKAAWFYTSINDVTQCTYVLRYGLVL